MRPVTRPNLPITMLLQLLVVALSIGYAIHMQGLLPEIVPTHHGNLIGHTDRDFVVWLLPGAEIFFLLISGSVALIARSDASARAAAPVLNVIMLIGMSVLAGVHVSTLQSTLASIR